MGKRKTETYLVVPTVHELGEPLRKRLIRGTRKDVEQKILADFHIIEASIDDANACGQSGVAIENAVDEQQQG